MVTNQQFIFSCRRFLNKRKLFRVVKYIDSCLDEEDRQNIVNCIDVMKKQLSSPGKGLTSGMLIDMFLTEFLGKKDDIEKYHNGESDFKIFGLPLSLKSISGRSTIALNWSKNDSVNQSDYFNVNILIFVSSTSRWWIKNDDKIINSGFYFINKDFCKQNITLSKNNKTNSLITNRDLYKLLINAEYFIKLPNINTNDNKQFNILHCFYK